MLKTLHWIPSKRQRPLHLSARPDTIQITLLSLIPSPTAFSPPHYLQPRDHLQLLQSISLALTSVPFPLLGPQRLLNSPCSFSPPSKTILPSIFTWISFLSLHWVFSQMLCSLAGSLCPLISIAQCSPPSYPHYVVLIPFHPLTYLIFYFSVSLH